MRRSPYMARALVVMAAAIGLGAIAFAFVYCARSIDPYALNKDQGRGVDFVLRLAEVDCLRSGTNPFYVWHGDVNHDLYCSVADKDSDSAIGKLPVNAYTPWEYMYVYPLSLVKDWSVRWWIFTGLRFLAFLLIVVVMLRRVLEIRCRFVDGCLCLACLSTTVGAVYADLMPSNFAIFLSAFALGMCVCLNHRWDCCAGICWALLMSKPQIGLLFAVPLLIGGRWKTVVVASGICALASVPPMLMCGDSFLNMIQQAPAASVHGFHGCALLPFTVFDWVVNVRGVSSGVVLFAALMFGAVLCFVASWKLRTENDWLVKFFPCAVLALSWTYVQSYSYCLAVLPIAVLVMELVKAEDLRRMVLCMVSIFLFSNLGHDLVRLVIRAFSICGPESSDVVSSWVRQVSSSLAVIACMVWCCRWQKNGLRQPMVSVVSD